MEWCCWWISGRCSKNVNILENVFFKSHFIIHKPLFIALDVQLDSSSSCGSKSNLPAIETIGNLMGIRMSQFLLVILDECLNDWTHQSTPNIIPLDDIQILTKGLVNKRLNMNDREFRLWNHCSCHGLCKWHKDLGECGWMYFRQLMVQVLEDNWGYTC